MLIILSGLPGTGKSAVADAIARALRLPVISVDPIESAILRAGIAPSFETGLAAYLVAATLADGIMAAGLDTVIDAVNSVEYARDLWRALARKHDVEMRIIVCNVSDGSVHAARLASRDRGLALGEPTAKDVEHRRSEWTPWSEPYVTLDGTGDLAASVAEALRYLV